MTPDDIRRMAVVEELDLSVDGQTAVVARRTIQGNRYLGHLFAIDLGAGRAIPRPRQLTRGMTRDTKPRLCPDGHTLAFIRTDPSRRRRPGGYRHPRYPAARSDPHGAVGATARSAEIAWAPDGRRLAFTAEVDPPRFITGKIPPSISRRGKSPHATTAPVARRITRTDWRWDEEGHRDRWSHLFISTCPAAAPPGDARRLGRGRRSRGTRTVGTSCSRATADPQPDLHPRTTIWSVDVDATGKRAEPREVLAAPGWSHHPAVSPDGRWIAALGVMEPEPLDDMSPSILVGPADGSRPPRALAPDLDRPIGNWVDTDLNGWFVEGRHGPFWLDVRPDRWRPSRTAADRVPASSSSTRAGEGPADVQPAAEGDLVTHSLAVARRPDGGCR